MAKNKKNKREGSSEMQDNKDDKIDIINHRNDPLENTFETAESAPEKSEFELLKEEKDALQDKYLRLMAEYDNFRKRSHRERESIYPDATAAAVAKFLPVLDNFERAMTFECADEAFKKGIEMIFSSYVDVLSNFGVSPVGENGELFDPNFHNAVMHVEDDALEENVVAEVLQKGYKIGDRIIRCAMVKVAN